MHVWPSLLNNAQFGQHNPHPPLSHTVMHTHTHTHTHTRKMSNPPPKTPSKAHLFILAVRVMVPELDRNSVFAGNSAVSMLGLSDYVPFFCVCVFECVDSILWSGQSGTS